MPTFLSCRALSLFIRFISRVCLCMWIFVCFFFVASKSLINHQSFVTGLLFYLRLIETNKNERRQRKAIIAKCLFAFSTRNCIHFALICFHATLARFLSLFVFSTVQSFHFILSPSNRNIYRIDYWLVQRKWMWTIHRMACNLKPIFHRQRTQIVHLEMQL